LVYYLDLAIKKYENVDVKENSAAILLTLIQLEHISFKYI